MSRASDGSGRRPAKPLAVFVGVLALVAAAGLLLLLGWYAPNERAAALAHWRSSLAAMGEDRQAAIEGWVASSLTDARHVARFPTVLRLATDRRDLNLARPELEDLETQLSGLLDDVTVLGDYEAAYVLDVSGRAIAANSGATPLLEPCARSAIASGLTGAPTVGLQLHPDGPPAIAFMAPVQERSPSGANGRILGVVVLIKDPQRWLFPFLTRRANPASSLETLLAEPEGEEIVFLPPQRSGAGEPTLLRVRAPGVAEAMFTALAGTETVGGFRDYRNVAVLASTRRVSGTRWGLVVKVDIDEALAPARSEILAVGTSFFALLLALAAGALAIWRSQRARLDRELAESDRRFAVVLENANDAIQLIGLDGRIRAVNRQAEELYGYSRQEMQGMPVDTLVARSETGGIRERMDRVSRDGGFIFQSVHRDRSGREIPVEVSARLVEFGRERLFFSVIRDISERKRTEDRLALLAQAVRSVGDCVGITDLRGRLVFVNEKLLLTYGYSEEALLGRSAAYLSPRQGPMATGEAILRDSLAGGWRGELRQRRKDGGEFLATLSTSPVLGAAGEPIAIVGIVRDITAQRAAEDALRESEERFRTLVASIGEGMGIVDPDERFAFANAAADRIFGLPPGGLIGRTLAEFVTPAAMERLVAETRGRKAGASTTYELEIAGADGMARTLVVNAAPLQAADGSFRATSGVFRDVTEERRLGEQLLHAQKMEAIGRLAGGIAHDFNNLLQAMLNLTQLLRLAGTKPERAATIMSELEQHVRRGSGLARQLLLFSRRETTKMERLDLTKVVQDASRLLARLLRENIGLEFELAPEALPFRGDRGQVEQILLNLAVNSSDAMPEGGRLTVATRAAATDVILEVRDTGHGIPAELRERVFEPFFSTKGADKGTGLGLSVVDGIVHQHAGRIEVDSETDRGTVFRISFPRLLPEGAPAAPTPAVREPAKGAPGGVRVLVVEDEEATRTGLVEVLTMLGYQATAVASGEKAGVLPAEPAFDVLLTDFLLPGIGGVDLARGLRDRWPDLRVILMSGYTEDDMVRETVSAGRVRFLQKPFDIDSLARELDAAMMEPPGSPA